MNVNNRTTKSKKKRIALCTCTYSTHFLGRCRKRVKPPAERCTECIQDHTPFTQAAR